jgi:transcriptional regulator with XRE-family HTH domain
MKLGDVLRKEREKKGATVEEAATKLQVDQKTYEELEGGTSDAEKWGPLLAEIAIRLETPTSRLISETGRSDDYQENGCGNLISHHRERRKKTVEDMTEALEISQDEYQDIEAGKSPLEQQAPRLLRFAELIEQPIFNLFYPCGLPFQELDDYP